MKVVTIIGARPQFIKARPLSEALRDGFQEVVIHTGQHYDRGMSDQFFEELAIPEPKYHLGIGGGGHGEMTGKMLVEIEKILLNEHPSIAIVFGDTNSTLAGALAASKLHIPVAHVEAGLRSFNRAMPEELNRILTDHLSSFLFAPSEQARMLLAREGIEKGVSVVGDIMFDSVRLFAESAKRRTLLSDLALSEKGYYLCTLHRAENVDSKERLSTILGALGELDAPVLFPRHPRTEKMMREFQVPLPKNFIVIPPAGYLDMLQAQMSARCVLTDSGGVQKEAFYCGVPCVTLRTETEWRELVESGWNVVSGVEREGILRAVEALKSPPAERKPIYGEGNTATLIASILRKFNT